MEGMGSNNKPFVYSIVLAHPHVLIREGIARILNDGGFKVVGQADNITDIYTLVSECTADLILLDWEISEIQADSVKSLNNAFPDIRIVVLTRPHSSSDFVQALDAGAQGYLSVNLSPYDFIQALHMLIRGSFIVAQEKPEEVDTSVLKRREASKEMLSDREKDVLIRIGEGSTNREIAEELVISEHTVKVHLRTILNKLNLRNRQQAAAHAIKIGLIKDIKASQDSTA